MWFVGYLLYLLVVNVILGSFSALFWKFGNYSKLARCEMDINLGPRSVCQFYMSNFAWKKCPRNLGVFPRTCLEIISWTSFGRKIIVLCKFYLLWGAKITMQTSFCTMTNCRWYWLINKDHGSLVLLLLFFLQSVFMYSMSCPFSQNWLKLGTIHVAIRVAGRYSDWVTVF